MTQTEPVKHKTKPLSEWSYDERSTALFLLAAFLPAIAILIGSIINPHGWLAWYIPIPYMVIGIMLSQLISPVFIPLAIIGIILIVTIKRQQPIKPKVKNSAKRFFSAVIIFILSVIYSLYWGISTVSAAEHEFVG